MQKNEVEFEINEYRKDGENFYKVHVGMKCYEQVKRYSNMNIFNEEYQEALNMLFDINKICMCYEGDTCENGKHQGGYYYDGGKNTIKVINGVKSGYEGMKLSDIHPVFKIINECLFTTECKEFLLLVYEKIVEEIRKGKDWQIRVMDEIFRHNEFYYAKLYDEIEPKKITKIYECYDGKLRSYDKKEDRVPINALECPSLLHLFIYETIFLLKNHLDIFCCIQCEKIFIETKKNELLYCGNVCKNDFAKKYKTLKTNLRGYKKRIYEHIGNEEKNNYSKVIEELYKILFDKISDTMRENEKKYYLFNLSKLSEIQNSLELPKLLELQKTSDLLELLEVEKLSDLWELLKSQNRLDLLKLLKLQEWVELLELRYVMRGYLKVHEELAIISDVYDEIKNNKENYDSTNEIWSKWGENLIWLLGDNTEDAMMVYLSKKYCNNSSRRKM